MANHPIFRVLKLKCPKCGEGDLFCNKSVYQYKGYFDLPEVCPVCKQDFKIEPGFYYGAMYVSYGLTIAVNVAVFIAMSVEWYLIADVITLILTLPYLFKVSRALWIALVVKPEKNFNNA